MWLADRIAHTLGKQTPCPLCNETNIDKWHAFWTCPYLAQSEDEAIKNSQHVISSLKDDKVAFFNRGIICEHQLTIPEHNHPLEEYPLTIVKSNPELPGIDFSWPSGLYFGDGSGGVHNHDNIRRCGIGITHVDNKASHKPLYNISMPLPGNIQTVPRAELMAVLVTVTNIEYFGTIDFFTDSEITKNTYYKGKHRAKHANNADRWTELFQIIDTKNIDLRLYWMPSHTADNPEKKARPQNGWKNGMLKEMTLQMHWLGKQQTYTEYPTQFLPT